MTMQKILLSGNDWQICQDERGPHLDWAEGWLSATVPGNIQGDLQDDRLLKPLRYGLGDDRLMSVCLSGWWYRKVFTLPAIQSGQRVSLSLGSVDYSSAVYVNGKEIGQTEGQFNRFVFDITDAVSAGVNELKVHIDPMPEELAEWLEKCDGALSGEGTDYHFVTVNDMIRRRLKGLKSPGTCSYDWAYNVYTLGLWKDVEILITGTARIDWLCLRSPLSDNYTKGSIDVLLETDSLTAMEATPCLEKAEISDGKVTLTFTHVYDGLKAEEALNGFAVCDAEGVWRDASAAVSGKNTVTVWCDAVSAPTGVKYAQLGYMADVNAYNSADLPILPFVWTAVD